jgi:hypothetical protein
MQSWSSCVVPVCDFNSQTKERKICVKIIANTINVQEGDIASDLKIKEKLWSIEFMLLRKTEATQCWQITKNLENRKFVQRNLRIGEFNMGKLLSLLARDNSADCCGPKSSYDIFLDFENAQPTSDELEVYKEIAEVLEKSDKILEEIQIYKVRGHLCTISHFLVVEASWLEILLFLKKTRTHTHMIYFILMGRLIISSGDESERVFFVSEKNMIVRNRDMKRLLNNKIVIIFISPNQGCGARNQGSDLGGVSRSAAESVDSGATAGRELEELLFALAWAGKDRSETARATCWRQIESDAAPWDPASASEAVSGNIGICPEIRRV